MNSRSYQFGPRWQGVRANMLLFASYISPVAKTAVDIGSNEGVITCCLDRLGLQATGFEQNKKYNDRARQLNGKLGGTTIFKNQLFTEDDVKTIKKIDVVSMLSVHHQIVDGIGIDKANTLLRSLADSTQHQIFFQPACISAKYKTQMPFKDNDYAAVVEYFRPIFADAGFIHLNVIGFSQNDMPKWEPFRPMLLLGREPSSLVTGDAVIEPLKAIESAVSSLRRRWPF